jgi:hypothetical protein
VGQTLNLVVLNPETNRGLMQSFRQHQITPELEFRFLLQGETGSLFLLQRDRFYYLWGYEEGASHSWGFDTSLGVIWRLGDNIYLDADVTYRQTECIEEPCSPAREIRPRLLLSAKL